jgi:photosystem II stability/assembly factor-like uncharacterized protein
MMNLKMQHISAFVCLLVLGCWGCSKFDRSKIKMPKFHFATTSNVQGIAYLDPGHIWISGDYGAILFSGDAGATWTSQDSGVKDELLSTIRFVNDKNGWASGVGGTIVHTTDGGATWRRQKTGTERYLLDMFFLDVRHGWAVGEFGTILRTQDGGATWNPSGTGEDKMYNGIYFADSSTGWIVGEFGTIMISHDGGMTWTEQPCKDLEVEGADEGWEKPKPALYSISFADRLRGWIVGMDGVILHTGDGGMTWRKLASGTDKPLYSLVVKGQNGWAVGNKGVYITSTDGGMTWAEKPDAIKTKFWLRNMAFCDDRNGIIGGARGTIVLTSDGGATWDIISGFRYDMEEFGLADF